MEEARRDAGVSAENVAAVREFTEAFNRLDFDSVIAELDPQVELREWPAAADSQTYRGRDGVRAALDKWLEAWEWMRVEILDMVEVDERVLLTAHQRAKGRGSMIEVEITSFNVYTFRDGKLTLIELFTERDPALEAAGLAPSLEEEKS